jgi:hypothetical protein
MILSQRVNHDITGKTMQYRERGKFFRQKNQRLAEGKPVMSHHAALVDDLRISAPPNGLQQRAATDRGGLRLRSKQGIQALFPNITGLTQSKRSP